MPAGSTKSRYTRPYRHEDESKLQTTTSITSNIELDIDVGREEEFRLLDDEECGVDVEASPTSSHFEIDSSLEHSTSDKPKWTRRRRIPSFRGLFSGSRRSKSLSQDRFLGRSCSRSRTSLRFVLKCLAVAFMLLGLLQFVLLVVSLVTSFFPSEFEDAYSKWRLHRPHDPASHWPTDYTADIQPVQCHSHNDYWRRIPLRSAIEAGCTGVEADVWLFPKQSTDELYVGHSRSSLTPQRTFKSLYIDPLVEILERQNPNTTFHPALDLPRNGVFDTTPEQSLVLLVDFKTDGQELWSYVSQQLEPLRKRRYLTYFNGTSVVEGPVTVVVTGNAPFNRVVENAKYRDMFFDAPLELLGNLSPSPEPINIDLSTKIVNWTTYDEVEERTYLANYAAEQSASLAAANSKQSTNQGQGHSGAAPKNPAIYTPANSYYASVSFTSTIGHALPFLTRDQKRKVRQQIRGAHKQGLKVRYWNTPGWPIGLRNYMWRVLVEEGVDYLNVDDLLAATKGHWGRPRRHRGWDLRDWSLWNRR